MCYVGPSLGFSPAAATPWEATRTERSSRERPGSGLGWGPSSGLLPEPRPAPHVVSGVPVVGGGVVFSSSSNGVGGEPPSRPSAYWDDPHFRPHFDNSTDRNVTAQLGKSAFLHCRIRQLGDRTASHYILGFKGSTGQLLSPGGRKTPILGFLLVLEFIKTHPELSFLTVHKKTGNNDKPTAIEFRSAYRKCLVSDVLPSIRGNCEVDGTAILLVSSSERHQQGQARNEAARVEGTHHTDSY
ncbi:hypothetical protein HPB47_005316 [Ixodes persulcatus]|uniref:Uncharacterized protein n=1 Tax=Ixodes persulcatus TaxID=34615 RepID=A0AC60PE83_IXOPE|nr:hypothetical protein HPB47_005316 [Ixodes persulcatus]